MDFWTLYFLIGIAWGMLTAFGAGQEGTGKVGGVVASLLVIPLWPLIIVVAALDNKK